MGQPSESHCGDVAGGGLRAKAVIGLKGKRLIRICTAVDCHRVDRLIEANVFVSELNLGSALTPIGLEAIYCNHFMHTHYQEKRGPRWLHRLT